MICRLLFLAKNGMLKVCQSFVYKAIFMKLDPQKTIFLIDGSSFLYRAYYGTRPLHTSKGEPVNAVYSFCRMIKKLSDRFNPRYIVLVWDSKGPTTRHEMFEEYKATRQAPPSDLFDQKNRIQQFADLIGLHQLSKPGYEADDLMHALAKEQQELGKEVVFITSDKDMGQALTDRVYLYDYFKDLLHSKLQFEEKMGFAVEKLPFYFALLGDTSDNIPGVRGIGKKTAEELVKQFDSLEDMYERIDTIVKPRIKNALLENKDNAFLSRKLFLLQYIPTGVQETDSAFDPNHWIKAQPLFKELEFKSLLANLGITKEQREALFEQKLAVLKQKNFQLISTPIALANVAQEIEMAGAAALDTETDGVNPLRSHLVGLSMCTSEKIAYYIPFGHQTDEPQLSLDEVRTVLKPLLANPHIDWYFHNAKFDMHVLASHGMAVANVAFDSLIAASLITKDWQRIGLKHLAIFYFDEHMITYEDVVKAKKLKDFSYVSLELALYYSANDSYQTLKLVKLFEKELKKEGMDTLFYDIEMPLMRVLYEIEKKGILIDADVLKSLNELVSSMLARIESEILSLLGPERKSINLNSPKQIEHLLFYVLNLPPQKKSIKRTGYSTDQEVLEHLSKLHPVPGLILKYRELFKLQSTYIQALPSYINPEDNRIHTTFSQTRVATGRLSSFDPNLQNVPASGVGMEVRAAFKPDPGYRFISADYSQIELRVLAYFSQDEALITAFKSGRDIHRETAARLFNVPFAEVTHAQRQVGKRINFSILYGLTPYGLSKDLNIPFGEAKQYIDGYFAQYPKVGEWMKKIIAELEERGYVTTYCGRRRYIPAIYEKNRILHEEAKRIAINTVAQGTAAEIMKQGMITLSKRFKKEVPDACMVLQIHDELLIQVPENQIEKAEELIKSTLEKVVDWNVPLEVSIRSGEDWKEVSK